MSHENVLREHSVMHVEFKIIQQQVARSFPPSWRRMALWASPLWEASGLLAPASRTLRVCRVSALASAYGQLSVALVCSWGFVYRASANLLVRASG
jgi:hypothetical protein